MGYTRVIFSDATTAEASSVLKNNGFNESDEGSCFLHPASPIKIYLAWGKSNYYPEIMKQLTFSPRIQMHFKSQVNGDGLTELARESATGLKKLSGSTRILIFDIDAMKDITS